MLSFLGIQRIYLVMLFLVHLAIQVNHTMVKKAINKMKVGKASGPSGIVAEMLKASGPTGVNLLVKIANSMIRNRDSQLIGKKVLS